MILQPLPQRRKLGVIVSLSSLSARLPSLPLLPHSPWPCQTFETPFPCNKPVKNTLLISFGQRRSGVHTAATRTATQLLLATFDSRLLLLLLPLPFSRLRSAAARAANTQTANTHRRYSLGAKDLFLGLCQLPGRKVSRTTPHKLPSPRTTLSDLVALRRNKVSCHTTTSAAQKRGKRKKNLDQRPK